MAIGLSLADIHLVGVPLADTSVNPARSIKPTRFADGGSLAAVVVHLAPLLGGALAAAVASLLAVDEVNRGQGAGLEATGEPVKTSSPNRQVVKASEATEQARDVHHLDSGQRVRMRRLERWQVVEPFRERVVKLQARGHADRLFSTRRALLRSA